MKTFTGILVQKRVHAYNKGDYAISARKNKNKKRNMRNLSSPSQLRFRNEGTDFCVVRSRMPQAP